MDETTSQVSVFTIKRRLINIQGRSLSSTPGSDAFKHDVAAENPRSNAFRTIFIRGKLIRFAEIQNRTSPSQSSHHQKGPVNQTSQSPSAMKGPKGNGCRGPRRPVRRPRLPASAPLNTESPIATAIPLMPSHAPPRAASLASPRPRAG